MCIPIDPLAIRTTTAPNVSVFVVDDDGDVVLTLLHPGSHQLFEPRDFLQRHRPRAFAPLVNVDVHIHRGIGRARIIQKGRALGIFFVGREERASADGTGVDVGVEVPQLPRPDRPTTLDNAAV